jgi:hypothetical protein
MDIFNLTTVHQLHSYLVSHKMTQWLFMVLQKRPVRKRPQEIQTYKPARKSEVLSKTTKEFQRKLGTGTSRIHVSHVTK